jgi:5-methylcytosine-specific restriction enzyme A
MRVCSRPGCPNIYDGTASRCAECSAEADKARGTATQRGYSSRGHRAFRAAVLTRDPACVLCDVEFSTVADHYPLSRRDLIAQGLNPNDPDAGRGLCTSCHNSETAAHQPGGFNAP